MTTSLSALMLGFASTTELYPRRSVSNGVSTCASTSAPGIVSCSTAMVIPTLNCSWAPSIIRYSNGRHDKLAELQSVRWRWITKATSADSNNYSPLEFLDPQSGEYKDVELTALEEEYGVEMDDGSADDESDPEFLKHFASTIGLDDEDVADGLLKKMRSRNSDLIVKQLEEGIGDAEDLLKAMYGNTPEFVELYRKIESLVEKGDSSSARDIVEGNYEALMEQLNEGSFGVEQVAMLDILAFLYLRLEDEDAAEQLLRQATELLELIPDTEEMVDNILEHVGTMFMKLKKPRDALPLFVRSLSIKKASGDVPSIVRTMIGLASTYSELNLGEKSIQLYRQILAYAEEALGSEDEDLAAPLMHLGSSLLDEGKVAEAEMTIERAVKLTEKTYGGKDGRHGVALCVLAQVKGSKGEFENALEFFRKGLQVIESCKDFKDDGSLDTIRMDVAALLTVMGREREANELLAKAQVMDKDQHAYYAAQQVVYLEKQAELFAEAGELEMSERALRHSLQLLYTTVGPDATQVSIVLQLLATLLHAQPDRQPEAEPIARESVRIREKNFGKHHLAAAEAYSYLASILHHQGCDAEAADLMYKVMHIQEKDLGFDCPELEETLEVLNLLLVNLGRHRETVPIAERLEQMKSRSSFMG